MAAPFAPARKTRKLFLMSISATKYPTSPAAAMQRIVPGRESLPLERYWPKRK